MRSELSKYFDDYLPTLQGKELVKDLRGISACFEILVKDVSEVPWKIVVDRGRLAGVGRDGPEPVARFEMESHTLFLVITAKESPQDAFFDGRIEIEGDMEMGLAFGAVLEQFFDTYPYTP